MVALAADGVKVCKVDEESLDPWLPFVQQINPTTGSHLDMPRQERGVCCPWIESPQAVAII